MHQPPRRIALAGALAALILVTALVLIVNRGKAVHEAKAALTAGGPGVDSRGPPIPSLADRGVPSPAAAGPASGPKTPAPAGEGAAAGGGDSGAPLERGDDRRGASAAREDAGKIDPREIPESAITDALLKRALRISSAPLGAALRKALEEESRGQLLGILIANLTEHGTNFTAEELPLLVDALKGEASHEIQSLLLAHIERMDAPEEKAAAYLSYLRESPSPSHAEEVVGRLSKIGSPEALKGLIGILEDGAVPRARRQVVEALGRIGDPSAVRPLSRVLERAEEPGERAAALRSLVSIGDRGAVEAILAHAAREENRSALAVLQTLDARKDPETVPLLAQALLDRTYPEFQIALLRKLSRDGDARIERTLQRSIEAAGEPRVLAAAAETLGGLGTRDSLLYLEAKIAEAPDPATRRVYQRAWKRISDRLSAERGRG